MNSFLRGSIVGVGLVFGVGLGVAVAFVLPSGSFESGQSISSGSVNANFAAIASELNAAQARLNALEGGKRVYTAPNGGRYSLDGSYCGKTAALNGAEVGGMTGAKVRCEAVCSPSAHMCTGEELTRLLATDLAFAQSSIPSIVWFQSLDDDGGTSGTCNGWTSNSHDVHATVLDNHVRFSWTYCDRRYPIACCD